MANATDIVKKGTVRRTDEFIKRPAAASGSDVKYFQHAGVGTTATGGLAKFDDTQPLGFSGLVRGDEGPPTIPAGSLGDAGRDLDEHQCFRFELQISGGVTLADLGRRVYALDDQTGTLSAAATTNANVYGTVVEVVTANIALVESPGYANPKGHGLVVMAADGAVPIKHGAVVLVTKVTAAALTLADPTSGVNDGCELTILSTTAAAHTVTNAGSGFNAGGAASDVGTFAAAKGNNLRLVAYAGKWYVLENTGVTLA